MANLNVPRSRQLAASQAGVNIRPVAGIAASKPFISLYFSGYSHFRKIALMIH
jgi:hypothetical protein